MEQEERSQNSPLMAQPNGLRGVDRSYQVEAGPTEAYKRELSPFLFKVLERYPFLRRHPHPMLAHFPIVFMLSVSFFSLLYLVTGDQSFDNTAFYSLGGGLLAMPPAILTGLFTHWLNFPGEADRSIGIEKRLSYSVMVIALAAFFWRWQNPRVLADLAGINIVYLLLVLSLAPLVTANGYFGGMLTFPLEDESQVPDALAPRAPERAKKAQY